VGRGAKTLGPRPVLLLDRATMLAEQYPDAFARAITKVEDVPGADEVGDRTLPRLREHCQRLVQQLASA